LRSSGCGVNKIRRAAYPKPPKATANNEPSASSHGQRGASSHRSALGAGNAASLTAGSLLFRNARSERCSLRSTLAVRLRE